MSAPAVPAATSSADTPAFVFRPIEPSDNAAVARIIRTVMPEFGAAGPGFAIHDREVDEMYETYTAPGARSAYFVVVRCADGAVMGGGGVAPLQGYPAEGNVCELRKMYFLREARGHGMGQRLIQHIIEVARSQLGFKQMYLETLCGMDAAQHLYQKLGFRRIEKPMGGTGHFSCDRFFLMDL